uniref:Uncharacterized protein n=1 Tax=Electrophorus electricus TaxID=8005 RepID=A0A4W4H626_ELEEL
AGRRVSSCPPCYHDNIRKSVTAELDAAFQNVSQCVSFDSHKGFTVFTPNPNKRKDIQKKAEAELAALEDFPLSRAMGYVSLTPRPVGGRLTLEEVRIKQQQEMKIKDNKKQGPIDFQ